MKPLIYSKNNEKWKHWEYYSRNYVWFYIYNNGADLLRKIYQSNRDESSLKKNLIDTLNDSSCFDSSLLQHTLIFFSKNLVGMWERKRKIILSQISQHSTLYHSLHGIKSYNGKNALIIIHIAKLGFCLQKIWWTKNFGLKVKKRRNS